MDRWQDSLENEELKTSTVLDRYKTQEEAFQGLVDTKAKLGNSFPLLTKDATSEQRDEWLRGVVTEHLPEMMLRPQHDTEDGARETWSMLGVPAEGKDYTMPEGVKMDAENEEEWRKIAIEGSYTNDQFQHLISKASEADALNLTAADVAKEVESDRLKEIWGNAYEQNNNITDTLVEKFQDKDSPLGPINNAARLFIMNVAKSLSNDPQIFNQLAGPDKTPSPAEAREKLAEMRRSPIYHNRDGKYQKDERKQFLKRYNKLIAEAG